ncbi:hypothetical protein MAPG_09293 [Magnaporthiopsis poae ATCC 64411]|uniref:Uncharacterized protein n=1 Tax=Magnaporthiopsis poae (strain ATCC 64411 / 73-15) TaxID=644358 RepID=A0A0C4E9K0_MAGP6|nr:hypothetical protein MAPG_09293 [Magnaporthiopsis poae ATCC 64411]
MVVHIEALTGPLAAVDPPAPFAAAAIARRDLVSWGGYALLRKNCPSGTSSCDGSCCPDGYSCSGDYRGKVCCPDKTDCSQTVKAVSACADKSWTLWRSSCSTCITTTFCCAGDEVGTYDPAAGLQCINKAIPVPKSIIVSSIEQQTTSENAPTIGGAPTTTTGAGSRIRPTTSGSSPGSNPDSGIGPGTSSPSDSSSGGSGSAGLPQAAVVAIAVLATALGMLAASFACFVFYRRRKKAAQPHGGPLTSTPQQPSNGQQATAPPPMYYVAPHPQTEELHGQTAPVVVASVPESGSDPRFELAEQPRK